MLTVSTIVWERGAENCALHESMLNDAIPEMRLNQQTNMNDSSRQTDRRELNLNIEWWNPPLAMCREVSWPLQSEWHHSHLGGVSWPAATLIRYGPGERFGGGSYLIRIQVFAPSHTFNFHFLLDLWTNGRDHIGKSGLTRSVRVICIDLWKWMCFS